MSGGVDSTACGLLLKKHNVSGYFMNINQPDYQSQLERVREIAGQLKIPLTAIDLRQPFEKMVLNYFSAGYQQALTPNPCFICNQKIKFGLFFRAMQAAGADRIATGHYARIDRLGSRCRLLKGADPRKDQSYFLAGLGQGQLAKTIFPLGEMTKPEVYELVMAAGFTDFQGRESQDVCFLEAGKVGDFLERQGLITARPGQIVSIGNEVLAEHQGLHHYTIGQRKGLGISDATPYYVVALDAASNQVVVGKEPELFQASLTINRPHWLAGQEPDLSKRYQVRIRHNHRGAEAELRLIEGGCLITFAEPQRAVTPGQFSVIYAGDEVIGSGEIRRP